MTYIVDAASTKLAIVADGASERFCGDGESSKHPNNEPIDDKRPSHDQADSKRKGIIEDDYLAPICEEHSIVLPGDSEASNTHSFILATIHIGYIVHTFLLFTVSYQKSPPLKCCSFCVWQ